jgi:hypothetical protein
MFDAHRVGKHEYLFDSEHLDGRRCLGASEMDAELRMSAAGAQSCRVRGFGSGSLKRPSQWLKVTSWWLPRSPVGRWGSLLTPRES